MSRKSFRRDDRAATAVEFGLTAPLFIAALFGVIELGFVTWTELGLENGVETASRCAAIKSSNCATAAQIEGYAAQNALGLSIPSSAFTYTSASCGSQVSASYPLPLFSRSFPSSSLSLSAQACSPS